MIFEIMGKHTRKHGKSNDTKISRTIHTGRYGDLDGDQIGQQHSSSGADARSNMPVWVGMSTWVKPAILCWFI